MGLLSATILSTIIHAASAKVYDVNVTLSLGTLLVISQSGTVSQGESLYIDSSGERLICRVTINEDVIFTMRATVACVYIKEPSIYPFDLEIRSNEPSGIFVSDNTYRLTVKINSRF